MADEKDFEKANLNMTKEDADRWIKYTDAVHRLKKNPDFLLLFNVYTRSEVLRYSYMLADDRLNDAAKTILLEHIKSCGMFRNYIENDIEAIRERALNTIEAYNEEEQRQVEG